MTTALAHRMQTWFTSRMPNTTHTKRETTYDKAIAESGRPAARAAARLMATTARGLLSHAERILQGSGDIATANVAEEAGQATTLLIAATYDGNAQIFACKR
jgi:hypothetical protein